MLHINFSGPRALLPNNDNVPLLHALPEAWQPRIFLWTFFYNQAYRVNLVEVCARSVAERHTELLAEFLAGKRKFYRATELSEGVLEPAYNPHDDRAQFISEFTTLMSQLIVMRIFFAPFSGPMTQLKRIGDGIMAHFQQLGGRAAGWLKNTPLEYDRKSFDEAFTLRLGRPAFIGSLPDELHL